MTLKLCLHVTIGWIYRLYLRVVSVGLFSLNDGPLIINEMLKIWIKVNDLLGWKSFCSEYLRYRENTFLECVLEISSGKQHAWCVHHPSTRGSFLLYLGSVELINY